MRVRSSAGYCKRLAAYETLWLFLMGVAVALPGHARQMGTVQVEPEERRISAIPGDFEFDVTRHSIPLREIRGGGPPKDGIPALVNPKFVAAQEIRGLRDQDQVLGIAFGEEAKAYPVGILTWHELVNDRVGGRPVLVSW